VSLTSSAGFTASGPASFYGTFAVSGGQNSNIVIAATGNGTVSIDSGLAATAGTGIKIGTTNPGAVAGVVQIGTKSGSGTTVRANLDTYLVTGSATATTGTADCTSTSDLALSAGCSCASGNIEKVFLSLSYRASCQCGAGINATATVICLKTQ
jgi:hypothetical protein